MKLSVVATLYNGAAFIAEFVSRAHSAAQAITPDYEVVLVNDGSKDESLAIALEIFESDRRLRVLDLGLNYGHYVAMVAAIARARGDYVFLIDSDLEEAPELLARLWPELTDHSDRDLVFAYQKERKRGVFENLTGSLFYQIVEITSGLHIPRDAMVARLMTRNYANAITSLPERPVSFDILSARTAFHQFGIAAEKKRIRGTDYSLRRKLSIVIDSILGYGVSLPITLFLVAILMLGMALLVHPATTYLVGGVILLALAGIARTTGLILEQLRYTQPRARRFYTHD